MDDGADLIAEVAQSLTSDPEPQNIGDSYENYSWLLRRLPVFNGVGLPIDLQPYYNNLYASLYEMVLALEVVREDLSNFSEWRKDATSTIIVDSEGRRLIHMYGGKRFVPMKVWSKFARDIAKTIGEKKKGREIEDFDDEDILNKKSPKFDALECDKQVLLIDEKSQSFHAP